MNLNDQHIQTDAPLSVATLTAHIKEFLEAGFHGLRIIGEVSRLTNARSGHVYFTIKDEHAAISAVVWRSSVMRLRVMPKEGDAFIFMGHINVYAPRGTYTLVVTQITAMGEGHLAMALEQRKQHFAARGWFDAARKRGLPTLPKHIAVVTSATAAALQDVYKVLNSRPGWLKITLSPCLVQGNAAPTAIVRAIFRVQHQTDADIILLVRGGGSLEDLWCFNDESVVKAVVDCGIPIITGIGHEIDSTLVDFAADLRAATPSNAAELCCPSRQELRQKIPMMRQWQTLMLHQTGQYRVQLMHQRDVLRHTLNHEHDDRHHQSERQQELLHHHAARITGQQRLKLFHARQSLAPNVQQRIVHARQRWQALHSQLHSMNPWHVLQRGYAIVQDDAGKIYSHLADLHVGQTLRVCFHDGQAGVNIEQLHKNQKTEG
ncbi:MAG: exodeoxyribonuclease VII large subunit [Mariprofundaceae bacterium]|nr:exodeoxyribonuclease VII large subunit [Mariprofundaceae bacterium]